MTKKNYLFLAGVFTLTCVITSFIFRQIPVDDTIISYTADAQSQDIQLYWRNNSNKIFGSIFNLKTWSEAQNKTLVFAMNGGMYKPDNSPQGLFIQDYKTLSPIDSSSGNGNFYLKPNGIFYITTENNAVICSSGIFADNDNIRFATQSGPMLMIDGELHSAFRQGSNNLHIRNGVGILPDGKILFAMSKKEINLYDFATYFKEKGCKNALYLDGFVSRMYLPEKEWIQTDGNFGVIIGITKPQ